MTCTWQSHSLQPLAQDLSSCYVGNNAANRTRPTGQREQHSAGSVRRCLAGKEWSRINHWSVACNVVVLDVMEEVGISSATHQRVEELRRKEIDEGVLLV